MFSWVLVDGSLFAKMVMPHAKNLAKLQDAEVFFFRAMPNPAIKLALSYPASVSGFFGKANRAGS